MNPISFPEMAPSKVAALVKMRNVWKTGNVEVITRIHGNVMCSLSMKFIYYDFSKASNVEIFILVTTDWYSCRPGDDGGSLECDKNARCVKPEGFTYFICECKGNL